MDYWSNEDHDSIGVMRSQTLFGLLIVTSRSIFIMALSLYKR